MAFVPFLREIGSDRGKCAMETGQRTIKITPPIAKCRANREGPKDGLVIEVTAQSCHGRNSVGNVVFDVEYGLSLIHI